MKTLKGAGLLNLSSDDAAPATAGASSPVKAGRAKASKVARTAFFLVIFMIVMVFMVNV